MFQQIRGLENYFINDKGVVKNKRGMILKTFLSNDGYELVTLSKNGIKSNHYIHILVADSFIKPKQGTTQIDHKNLDRRNNNSKNLRRVTPKQNSNNRGLLHI